jgi:hypothetical protein
LGFLIQLQQYEMQVRVILAAAFLFQAPIAAPYLPFFLQLIGTCSIRIDELGKWHSA